MLEAIRRAMSFLRHRQILHKLGVATSVTVIGIACYVLYHMLRGIDVNEVIEAIESTEPRSIALSALFVAAGYFTLTFYDLFAVRAIGRNDIPYRVNALAAFTSYSIGHNVGASVFTGGAVRYRIYSGWGLNAIDVAKICFVTGLTFWLGNLTVLGSGMAFRPDGPARILMLPPEIVRFVGIAALVTLVAYVTFVSRRPRMLGREGWRVVVPGGFSTLVQIGIALADLGASSLAMYSLTPTGSDYPTIATAFVAATLLGFASHAPGSLGVFDAAMLVALPQIGREELVAALLVFRLLYFMIPFALALTTMAIWETALMLRKDRTDKPAVTASGPNGAERRT